MVNHFAALLSRERLEELSAVSLTRDRLRERPG